MAVIDAVAPFTALVVDDDDFVRGVVAQQLRSLGAAGVATAADGRQARERLGAGRAPELIVCDLMMPGADGIELMRDVADACPAVALVLMSSAPAKVLRCAQELAQRRGLRVLGHLAKPVRRDALQALLRQLPLAAPVAAAAVLPPPSGLDAARIAAGLDAGEFTVHVQPQLDLQRRRLGGAEALVRWQHPQRGLLMPEHFLPLVEQAGLMDRLTETALACALRACGAWRAQGLALQIAVNFDPSTLQHPGLPERIDRLAARAGLPATALVVEVTERGLPGAGDGALEALTRLRLRDVELSIDDFGTGYSSLERLREMPFSELKIDRQFVAAAGHDAEARHIVEANLRLARDLGLRTVAEGVQSEADLALMTALGCDRAQGFHIAAPMDPERLPAWARARGLVGAAG